ncbi:hypothetical protein QTP88_001758 [Uroleucon formosanum]
MDSKKDWHYGKKSKTLLSKRKKNKRNIHVLNRLKKVNCINQTPSISSNTTSLQIIPEDNFKNNVTSELITPHKQYENGESCDNDKNNTSEYETPHKQYENGQLHNNGQWAKLEGRRIVDLKHVFQSLQSIQHLGFDCSFRDLEFAKENRKGYYSTLHFNCKVCGLKEQIDSENVNGENVNINMAIVSSLVEINCPASAKDMTPEEGISRFLFEKIKRDDAFWNDKIVTQLTTFYMDFMLKQLIKDELK